MSPRRVVTGLLLTAGVLLVLAFDGAFDVALGAFALTFLCVGPTLGEALVVLRKGGSHVYPRSGLFLGAAVVVARGALELFDLGEPGLTRTALVLGPLAVLGLLAMLAARRRFGPTLTGVMWVAGSLVILLELRLLDRPVGHVVLVGDVTIPFGMALLVVVVAAVKGGDSAAYVVGRTVGRTPMAPRISPKKTWEGAVGGLVAGTLLGPLLGAALGLMPVLGCPKLLVLGAATNLAGQIGDLAESWAKRRAGMKDSGRYLGELGGLFDILDSVLVASPVAYFVARLLGAG